MPHSIALAEEIIQVLSGSISLHMSLDLHFYISYPGFQNEACRQQIISYLFKASIEPSTKNKGAFQFIAISFVE